MRRRPARLSRFGLPLLVMLTAGPAMAGVTGGLHSGASRGLRVSADTRGLDGSGYRPVTVTISPIRPTKTDRRLTVEFRLDYNSTRRNSSELQVFEDVLVPAGSTPTEVTLRVPRMHGWQRYAIKVRDRDDSKFEVNLGAGSGNGWETVREECLPNVLVVGAEMPKTCNLAALFNLQALNASTNVTGPKAEEPAELPTAMNLTSQDLPSRWIDYSNYDFICIRQANLEYLATAMPRQFEAILRWTATGGNLLVSGQGDDWENLPRLEQLLQYADLPDTTPATPKERGWDAPNRSFIGSDLHGSGHDRSPFLPLPTKKEAALAAQQNGYYQQIMSAESDEDESSSKKEDEEFQRPPRPKRASFVTRSYQGGKIVAITHDDAFDFTTVEWAWLLNTLTPDRYTSVGRVGVSTIRANDEFGEFIVPGVGEPPANAFRLLITLFVLVIGPLNIFLLKRWRRMYLLVLTIPAGAAMVTVGLLLFAVLSDGIHTRARVRSVTHLDQRLGQAVCWSRLSYYAGLTPSEGLRFSGETMVVPLLPSPATEQPQRRVMVWGEDQTLTRGWIKSRTPTQFVTVRCRDTEHGLKIIVPSDASEDGAAEISVENHLDAFIHKLLVCTKDGQYYWATDIPARGTVDAERAVPGISLSSISRSIDGDELEYSGDWGVEEDYRWYELSWLVDSADYLTSPTQSSTPRERMLADLLTQSALEPGSYVAVVDASSEVELGTPKAKVEASLHVVFGQW